MLPSVARHLDRRSNGLVGQLEKFQCQAGLFSTAACLDGPP